MLVGFPRLGFCLEGLFIIEQQERRKRKKNTNAWYMDTTTPLLHSCTGGGRQRGIVFSTDIRP